MSYVATRNLTVGSACPSETVSGKTNLCAHPIADPADRHVGFTLAECVGQRLLRQREVMEIKSQTLSKC